MKTKLNNIRYLHDYVTGPIKRKRATGQNGGS